ncbi:hypothetical protein TWF281_011775 [Arthrobotrys megalospora]
MQDPHGFIFFLILFLLRISFTIAADDPKPWILMIRKEFRKDTAKIDALWEAVQKSNTKDEKAEWAYKSTSEEFGTLFMTFHGTEASRDGITKAFAKNNQDVISSWSDYTKHREALYTAYASKDYTVDRNINQRQERLMMAQEQGQNKPERYYYHNSQGEGVTVYFIDTGINRKHPEFIDVEKGKRLEVIFAGPNPPVETRQHIDVDSSLRFSHGSSVAGVVVGKVTGLAPKAHAVMIAALDRGGQSSEISPVIVNLSLSAGYLVDTDDAVKKQVRETLEEVWGKLMGLKNVIVTAASGVSEWDEDNVAYSWPVIESKDGKKSPNLIVVGGVDPEGNGIFQRPPKDSQAVFAPAYAVKIASNIGYQLTTGTSFASAYAAGILANYLSRDPSLNAEGARDLLIKNSYARKSGGPPVIWAGITRDEAEVTEDDLDLCKRADGANCKPKGSKTSTKEPTAAKGDTDGFPTPPSDDGSDDEGDDDGGVSYIATKTILEKVRPVKVITVDPNNPSSVPKDGPDSFLDKKPQRRAAIPNTSNLTLRTSTTTGNPRPEAPAEETSAPKAARGH